MNAKKDEFYRQVGERIRSTRQRAEIGIQAMANRTGLNLSTVQHAEDGVNCSLYVLAVLAEELDVTLDELVPVEALA